MPISSGVYFFLNKRRELLYIGKAKSLAERVSSYFRVVNREQLLPRTRILVSQVKEIFYLPVASEVDALLLEANFIRKFAPKYNVSLKDGKNYPLIEITVKEAVPMVKIVRREENPRALYFGPYPTGSDIRSLLRFLRRLFPFISEYHYSQKTCLRSHLGLCPCPRVFNDNKARQNYRQDINNLMDFLSGRRETVQKRLRQEMNLAAKDQLFEEAEKIKWKLSQINFLTSEVHSPWDYESNPNLLADSREREIKGICEVIPGVKYIPDFRLECYDIAHLSGKLTTGSMVVSVNGELENRLYRHFRMKVNNADDFAAITEVLQRRLGHPEWPFPDLIIIDGGAGQVTTAVKAVRASNLNIPVIGLAKRAEEIFRQDGQIVRLDRKDPALKQIQRLRDEAHRFSRRYHFLLRKRSMLK